MVLAAPAPASPPFDYSLTISDLIDFHATRNPRFPLYVYPNDNAPGDITEITFLEFGRAANRVAHVLRPGRHGPEGQVVVLIATTDTLLYHTVVAGMSIAGLIPFPVSPRNSPAAIADMMRKTGCSRISTLLHAHESLIDSVRQEMLDVQLYVEEIPTLAYAFPKLGCEVESDPFESYPSSRPLNIDNTAIYFQSSDGTGTQPISISFKVQVNWMNHARNYDYCRELTSARVGAMSLPPFHAYGMMYQLYVPFARVIPALIYPPQSVNDPRAAPIIPSPDNIINCVKQTRCGLLMTLAVFVDQWYTSPEAIEELKKLDLLVVGGVLPMKIGDTFHAAGVPIGVTYLGAEFGAITSLPDKQDIADGNWEWMKILPGIEVRWEHQGGDTYECQILSSKSYQPSILNLPDVSGYATSDLFVKHPKKDMWKIVGRKDDVKIVGRKDDVIVLTSGEKIVPAPIESIIESGPLVQKAVVFGWGRNQVGVLIEPRAGHGVDIKDQTAIAAFRDKIWPLIHEANVASPTFSRVFKDMILIISHDKPMVRSGKGSVQRNMTLKEYESEIDALYEHAKDTSRLPNGSSGPSAWTTEALEAWLMKKMDEFNSGRYINPGVDVFVQGFDDLGSAYLRKGIICALRKLLGSSVQDLVSVIPDDIVRDNPTIQLLSSRIAALVKRYAASHTTTSKFVESRKTAISEMIERYSVGLTGPVDGILGDDAHADGVGPAVVLLTGSTGSLGSHLLVRLLENEAVRRVYALNRPSSTSSVEQRQRLMFTDKGCPLELLKSKKLVYVEADAVQEKCGIPGPLYDEIRSSVTVVIHNAWRLNFNHSLSDFEPNIRATRNLVDLALDSPHRNTIRFLFTSSILSANSWDVTRGPFPEEVQLDPAVATGIGYGESKYVAERIIVRSGLHATSLRIGQIAGGLNGSWAMKDLIPILMKSSVAIRAFPDVYGLASWLRPEDVAAVIMEVAFAKEVLPPALNIVNPRGVPCVDIMTFARDFVVYKLRLKYNDICLIPFTEWYSRLEEKATGALSDDVQRIPAIKLLHFFRTLSFADKVARHFGQATAEAATIVNMGTVKAQLVSKTMAEMQPIGEADVQRWIQYWRPKGFFSESIRSQL